MLPPFTVGLSLLLYANVVMVLLHYLASDGIVLLQQVCGRDETPADEKWTSAKVNSAVASVDSASGCTAAEGLYWRCTPKVSCGVRELAGGRRLP